MVSEFAQPSFVLVGSYTSQAAPGAPGRGEGITVCRHDQDSGELTPLGAPTPMDDPSYLALHPDGRHVYAVSEQDPGTVRCYLFDPTHATLTPLGEARSTHGAAPCHVSVEPAGRYLAVANYASGTVAVHPLGVRGEVREASDVVRHHGHGPNAERQQGPHAHMAQFAAGAGVTGADGGDGSVLLHAVDLGTDEIISYRLDPHSGQLKPAGVARTAPGTGPRHLAHHVSGYSFVLGELDTSVTALWREPAGTLEVMEQVPALAEEIADPGSLQGANFPGAVAVSPCQRYLYVSNRGRDCVTSFRIGAGGELTATADVPTGGVMPREMRFVGRHLYAANQLSDTVVLFDVDAETGVPTRTDRVLHTPSPACLLPVPGE